MWEKMFVSDNEKLPFMISAKQDHAVQLFVNHKNSSSWQYNEQSKWKVSPPKYCKKHAIILSENENNFIVIRFISTSYTYL